MPPAAKWILQTSSSAPLPTSLLSSPAPDLRLAKAVREHTAWLSVDIVQQEQATPDNYRLLARIVSHLIGPGCLALYHPPRNQFATCSMEHTIEKLTSDTPIDTVFATSMPVLSVEEDPRP
ncbi:MAG: hypothetical protein FJW20_09250 [Acidimicrobiia bacterium]|nr:hypothetical protein [Acidimicrobiia bacterium]